MQAGLGLGVQYPVNAGIGVDFCAVIDRQNIGFGVDDHTQFGASQHNRLDAFLVDFGDERFQRPFRIPLYDAVHQFVIYDAVKFFHVIHFGGQ